MNGIATSSLLMISLASVGAAGMAYAAPADTGLPRVAVHYSAASLTTDAGARHLYYQLIAAAEKVCVDPAGDGHFPSVAAQNCRHHAVDAAVEKVHNPRLAAISNASAKSG